MKNFQELLGNNHQHKRNFSSNQTTIPKFDSSKGGMFAMLSRQPQHPTLKELEPLVWENPQEKALLKRRNQNSLSFQNLIMQTKHVQPKLIDDYQQKQNISALANQANYICRERNHPAKAVVVPSTTNNSDESCFLPNQIQNPADSPEMRMKGRNNKPRLFFNAELETIQSKPAHSINGIALVQSLTQSMNQQPEHKNSPQQYRQRCDPIAEEEQEQSNLLTITSSEQNEIAQELKNLKNQIMLKLVLNHKMDNKNSREHRQMDLETTINKINSDLEAKTYTIVQAVLEKRANKELYNKAREEVRQYLYSASKPNTDRTQSSSRINTVSSKKDMLVQDTPIFEDNKLHNYSRVKAAKGSAKNEENLSTGHKSISRNNEENLRYGGSKTSRGDEEAEKSIVKTARQHPTNSSILAKGQERSTTKSIKEQIMRGKSNLKMGEQKNHEIVVQ